VEFNAFFFNLSFVCIQDENKNGMVYLGDTECFGMGRPFLARFWDRTGHDMAAGEAAVSDGEIYGLSAGINRAAICIFLSCQQFLRYVIESGYRLGVCQHRFSLL